MGFSYFDLCQVGAARAFYRGMDSGLYAAYTGLMARTQALDTVANNVANAGTTGFRAQRDYFRGVLVDGMDTGGESQVGDGVNDFGVLGGSLADFAQGPVVTTGNPLDLALEGSGFFAVRTAQGVRYTRDGSLLKSPAGQLTNGSGEPVLDQDGSTITLPGGPIEISGDGTISAGGAVVAKVGVFDFASRAGLVAEGTNRFRAPAGAKAMTGAAEVKQGALEGANQDAVHSTMQLLLIQRQAEMMQKAMGLFSNEFDKTASEQLGKV